MPTYYWVVLGTLVFFLILRFPFPSENSTSLLLTRAPLESQPPTDDSLQHPFSSLYDFSPQNSHHPTNLDLVGNISEHFSLRFEGGGGSCYSTPAATFEITWEPFTTLEPDSPELPRCVSLGVSHTLVLRGLDLNGDPVCSGGDFIEPLVAGQALRSRLRFVDRGDGNYTATLLLPNDPLLVGPVVLSLYHLWSGFGGLRHTESLEDYSPSRYVYEVPLELRLYGDCPQLSAPTPAAALLSPPTLSCRSIDFMASPFWDGHWVAQPKEDASCLPGACTGSPQGVLSTSWVYRLPRCVFHLYEPSEARLCLNGSWIFSSGDSNARDTVANLAQLSLGLNMGTYLDTNDRATTDWQGADPQIWGVDGEKPHPEAWPSLQSPAEHFRFHLTNVWNSALYECCGDEAVFGGISVTKNALWKEKNIGYLSRLGDDLGPDVLFINSGLHDGMRYLRHKGGLAAFAADLEDDAVPWWNEMARVAAGDGNTACRPRVIWRHTVASAGPHRKHHSNPQSMALFNRLIAEALLKAEALEDAPLPPRPQPPGVCNRPFFTAFSAWRFLDMYDMTFPFHFDLQVSDGGHFGRHHCEGCDSVDRMQIQVLLNGLCQSFNV